MISRIFSAVRFLSILPLFIVLLFVYANISESVGLSIDEAGNPVNFISKNAFFYLSLTILVTINASIHMLVNLYRKTSSDTPKYREALLIWLNGLMILLNLFFITSLVFINAYNSLEILNLDYYGMVVFIILIVTTLWIAGVVPVLSLRGK